MTTLVLGSSGATGKLLVEQLLNIGQEVKIIVRPASKIPDTWESNEKISIIRANISEVSVDEMASLLTGCVSIASCLGHNISIKGVLGKPRKLVTDAVKLVCKAIQQNSNETRMKFVLMNTTAVRNMDLNERISTGEKIVMGLIRFFVPPQADNEQAADFLRVDIGQCNRFIDWVAVRPDTLIDNDKVNEYLLYASPIRSALSNPGKTSRINVGNFMARLMIEDDLWADWRGKMPVIYNIEKK